jgi:hypothetical protein
MENIDLIDWRMIGFAASWVTGLAIVLCALGFADYHAASSGRRFREEIARPRVSASINFGLALFCLGLAGSARSWWEIVLWIVLAAAFAGYTVHALLRLRREA